MSRASVPSYTGAIRRAKAPFMMSAHSSGSRRSAAAVEPLTSQNSIVTTRRSPCIPPPLRAVSSFAKSSGGMYRRSELAPSRGSAGVVSPDASDSL